MAPCQLALLGYPILACVADEKRPHPRFAPHGIYSASTDPKTIEQWLRLGINVAVHCQRLAVIDVDPAGLDWLEQHQHILKHAGAEAVTPRGGRHFWFSIPPGAKLHNSTNGIAKGVDLKTCGGYVLIPPSSVKQRNYLWVKAPNAPAEKLPALPPELIPRPTARPKLPPQNTPHIACDIIREGSRNCSLASIAGKLRRAGLVHENLYQALAEINQKFCVPPLPDREVQAIARSISKYPS